MLGNNLIDLGDVGRSLDNGNFQDQKPWQPIDGGYSYQHTYFGPRDFLAILIDISFQRTPQTSESFCGALATIPMGSMSSQPRPVVGLIAHGLGITRIPAQCFNNVPLVSLDMSYNDIASMDDYAFLFSQLAEFRCSFCNLRSSSFTTQTFLQYETGLDDTTYTLQRPIFMDVILRNEMVNAPEYIDANAPLRWIPNRPRRMALGYGWATETFNSGTAPYRFAPPTYSDYISKKANLLIDFPSGIFDAIPVISSNSSTGIYFPVQFGRLAVEIGSYTGPQGGLFANVHTRVLDVTITGKAVMQATPGFNAATYCPVEQVLIGTAATVPVATQPFAMYTPNVFRVELHGLDILLPNDTPVDAPGCQVPDCTNDQCQAWVLEAPDRGIRTTWSAIVIDPEPGLMAPIVSQALGQMTRFSHNAFFECFPGVQTPCPISQAFVNITSKPTMNLWNDALNEDGWMVDPESLCGYSDVEYVILPELPWNPTDNTEPHFTGLAPQGLLGCLGSLKQVFWHTKQLAGGMFDPVPPSLVNLRHE